MFRALAKRQSSPDPNLRSPKTPITPNPLSSNPTSTPLTSKGTP